MYGDNQDSQFKLVLYPIVENTAESCMMYLNHQVLRPNLAKINCDIVLGPLIVILLEYNGAYDSSSLNNSTFIDELNKLD